MTQPQQNLTEQADSAATAASADPFWRPQRLSRFDVRAVSTRERVAVEFADGRVYAGPAGTPVEAFVWQAWADQPREGMPIAVLLQGHLRELSTVVERDTKVRTVDTRESDGSRIYRRSLTFLLLAACQRILPNTAIAIEHSMPFGAYVCRVLNRPPLSAEEIAALQQEMGRLVEGDLPITSRRVPLEDVTAFFQSSGDDSKVSLLAHREKEDLALYSLAGIQNYFHGYMAPSTGYLRWYALAEYGNNFLLRFPRRFQPDTLQPIQRPVDLETVFQEYGEWMEKMKLGNVGSLNYAVQDGKMPEVILTSEALHERRIAQIASRVARSWRQNPEERVRAVLIAGPSSSGKTTFAKRLGIQLLSNGIRPYALSLDNYFVDREKTPLDEFGKYDFESIRALNLPLLNQQLAQLLQGEEVTMPRYNFMTGLSETGDTVQLAPNQVLILEGIHGLNPELAQAIPPSATLRVYVSVLAHLNMDRHNRIATSDVRLLRRIARDHRHRGYTAEDTIVNWPSVRRGEKLYIYPFQENSDIMFNSALLYELSVLRPVVEPLLSQIEWESPAYTEARRLLAFLRWIQVTDADFVPDNSIIREFIGGSILRHLTLT